MTDPRVELRALVASARALADWHRDAGSEGLFCSADPGELLAALAEPPKGKPRREAARAEAPRAAPPAFKLPQPAPQHAPETHRSPEPLAASLPAIRAAIDQPRLGADQRRAHLAVIADTVRGCTACGLSTSRNQTVFSRGSPDAELVFIGEGPGADEDAQGEPFVGKAGQLLDKMIDAMGLSRDEVYVCNIVKCRPPQNRAPEPAEMAACMPYLAQQLGLIQPKVMVALGATALRGLFGASSEGITKARGHFRLYQGAIPVMPTFHPAYVLRQPTKEIRGMVWSDLQQVLKHLGRVPPKRTS